MFFWFICRDCCSMLFLKFYLNFLKIGLFVVIDFVDVKVKRIIEKRVGKYLKFYEFFDYGIGRDCLILNDVLCKSWF